MVACTGEPSAQSSVVLNNKHLRFVPFTLPPHVAEMDTHDDVGWIAPSCLIYAKDGVEAGATAFFNLIKYGISLCGCIKVGHVQVSKNYLACFELIIKSDSSHAAPLTLMHKSVCVILLHIDGPPQQLPIKSHSPFLMVTKQPNQQTARSFIHLVRLQ